MNKNIAILVLLFLSISLILNTIFGWFTLNKDEMIAKEAKVPKNDTITLKEYVTKDSLIYVKFDPNVGELMTNNITRNYNTYVYDTLAPALRIAADKITELQQVKAKLEGKIKAQEQIIQDKSRVITYVDKYFTATTITDTLGKSEIDYKYNAQLDIVTTTDRKLFKKDVQNILITSPDKNFKVNNVEHFKKSVELPNRPFGLGLQIGYGISENGELMPYLGVGLNYNILKF